MAESNPLLSQSNSSIEPIEQCPSLDKTLEQYLEEYNLTQFFIALLVSFSWGFDAQQTFISVFTEAQPTWHCTNSSCNSSVDKFSLCNLPKNSTWEWDKPSYTSVISEWDLQCSSSLLKGLPASSFFFGCLFGGLILSTLADSSLGRKNMLLLSCLTMGCSSFLIVFSPNIWVYSGLKFVDGFGRASIGTCSLVLATEIVGKKWRGQVGVIGYFCFALGFLLLPLIAYINRESSWRFMYLWTSIPTILYSVAVYLFVTESPRWLIIRGKKEEAMLVLKRISPSKFSDLTINFTHLNFNPKGNTNNRDAFSAMKILLATKWACRRLLAVMAVGFGGGMAYYGMPLGLGNSSFNLYLSSTFNALSELPASLITLILIPKLNRKTSMLILSTMSGISSMLVVITRKLSTGIEIGLEVISYCCACSIINILLIFGTELFPTCVRNSGISMLRQAIVLGGAFGPMVVATASKNEVLPYAIFGLMIGICGLCVIFVKETRGEKISDTMEEEEEYIHRNKYLY